MKYSLFRKILVFGIILMLVGTCIIPTIVGKETVDGMDDVVHWWFNGSKWDWEYNVGNKPNIDIIEVSCDANEYRVTLELLVNGNIENSENIVYQAFYTSIDAWYKLIYSNGKGLGIVKGKEGGEWSTENVVADGNSISCEINVIGSDTSQEELFAYAYHYTDLYDLNDEYWVDFAPDGYFRPNTITVDDDYNAEDTFWWQYNHTGKIQHGINIVQESGTICVSSGTYFENVVVDKMLDLIGIEMELGGGSDTGKPIVDGGGTGTVIETTSDGVSISGFVIKNSGGSNPGLHLASHYNTIQDNAITENYHGMKLFPSTGNRIIDNSVIDNVGDGLWLGHSHENTIENNTITGNGNNGISANSSSLSNQIEYNIIAENGADGINISETSFGNSFVGNEIKMNGNKGVSITDGSDNNGFYHNSFVKNIMNAWDTCINSWDNGIEGNYWDDYNGVDYDHDGIGDAPYNISGGNNTDWYPLMEPWTSTNLPPSVQISYPKGKSLASGIITIQGIANDTDGTVETVQVKIDNSEWINATGTTSWSIEWNTSEVDDDMHTIYARSKDNDNASSVIHEVSVNVDNNLPDVRIEEPQKGYLCFLGSKLWPTRSGNTVMIGIGGFNIRVYAIDFVSHVNRVEFYIDDELDPREVEYNQGDDIIYSWLWDETMFGEEHTIKTVAYDLAGNNATAEIDVIVWNLYLPGPSR